MSMNETLFHNYVNNKRSLCWITVHVM